MKKGLVGKLAGLALVLSVTIYDWVVSEKQSDQLEELESRVEKLEKPNK